MARPTKYNYQVFNLFKESNEFSNEKQFGDFIEKSLPYIFSKTLKLNIKSMQREAKFGNGVGVIKQRVDFLCILQDGKRIGIECKRHFAPFRQQIDSIGQCLYYKSIFKLDEIYVISPCFHPSFIELIKAYDLPIKIGILNKTYSAWIL